MILTKLKLTDFGVFGGQVALALSPKPRRPVVLFGGKNGAGKSTILEALRLCLYGPAALGRNISKEEYLRYLVTKIHRNPTALIQPTFASISVEFQYGDTDGLATYNLTRSWEVRNGGKPTEYLALERNGNPLDRVGSEHWQDFVQELIPLGVSQLFFFDGEKIQQLAEDRSDQETLSAAIKSLLGLDIVERLQSDLGIHLSRQARLTRGKPLLREAEKVETEIAELREKLVRKRDLRGRHDRVVQELKAKASQIEGTLAAQGGTFARQREQLVERQATLREQIRQIENGIREQCARLLPFAVVPQLCVQLKDRLLREARDVRLTAGRTLLESARGEWLRRIKAPETWANLTEMSAETRARIVTLFERILVEPLEFEHAATGGPLHNLSEASQRQILAWIEQSASETPALVRKMADGLEQAYRELAKAEEALRKAPADDVLRPILDELHALNGQLARAGKEVLALDDEIRTLEAQIADSERRYKKLIEAIAAQARHNSSARLVPRVQKALDEYKTALLERKIHQLQEAVTECFNLLCRKKDTLRKIRINPNDFSVALLDRHNRQVPKNELSAGERQIYAISMLWALGKTSGRPLPIVVDTPLARLDSDHRTLLVRHYFPVASHQVLILSTDTEVDQRYFDELRPAVAHAYELEFDPLQCGTQVHSGYFWKEPNEAHQAAAH